MAQALFVSSSAIAGLPPTALDDISSERSRSMPLIIESASDGEGLFSILFPFLPELCFRLCHGHSCRMKIKLHRRHLKVIFFMILRPYFTADGCRCFHVCKYNGIIETDK